MYSISAFRYLKGLRCFAGAFLGLSILLRFVFLIWSQEPMLRVEVLWVFARGLFFDLSALCYALIPFALFIVFFPPFRKQSSAQRWFRAASFSFHLIAIFVFFVLTVSEITFWNEFHSRFNFIAVDYLVYTPVVLRNLWESFPLGWILSAVFASSFVASYLTWPGFSARFQFTPVPGAALPSRLGVFASVAFLVGANYFWVPSEVGSKIPSYALKEVSKNGIYSLFSSYFDNELDFERFYLSRPIDESFVTVRGRLKEDGELSQDPRSMSREIAAQGSFLKSNIVLVSMESMSASFMKTFGSKSDLTPNLDRLAAEGLLFRQIFATGTRTVRGLEALALSIPPTPGQSILRRPKNENLYGLGEALKSAGYAVEFLYGGYGFFDNMNAFFSSNGFDIVDEATIPDERVTFKNAWGVCDEDLFAEAVRAADTKAHEGLPFFQLIMTTSNHRPYTYPDKIDVPSGTGREGAVKYADFAIGEFLKAAVQKPWFKDTIFVFVADHDASVAGGIEVPVRDFRIPLIFYAPGRIAPQAVDKIGSQIDIAPTILGLLNAQYTSHLFGHDLLKSTDERAFFGTYLKVGLLRENILTLLGPKQTVEQFQIGPDDSSVPLANPRADLINEAISFYQVGSYVFKNGLQIARDDGHIRNATASSRP